MTLKVVEICAGAGGQSLGLHLAGFEHRLAVEIDANAAATLSHNLNRLDLSTEVVVGDVADSEVWKPEDHRGVDLVAGGVPCPPFSLAGKQLGSADERDLFAWAVELAHRVEPKALLLENVRGLSMPRFSGYRQAIADRLDELGYWSEWRLLHANDFGVAQLRPRFVLVALRREYAPYFAWPEAAPTAKTVGSELRDLMAVSGWRYAESWAEQASSIAPTVVGGSKKHGGADLGPTRAKIAWAKLAVDGKGIADGPPGRRDPSFRTKMPRLTNEMVARIQGWGDGDRAWEFLGPKTSVYRQIGNAFPPPVAEAVGRSVAHALCKEEFRGVATVDVAHDPVYRILRSADGSVPASELKSLLGLGDIELSARITALELDFEIETRFLRSDVHYRLRGFRAFRGQAEHARHAAFAQRGGRSRIS